MSLAIDTSSELRSLTEIEASVKGHLATMVRGTLEAFEARLAIGHDLLEARQLLVEDREFGRWASERFPWTRQWRSLLIRAAENEELVRGVVESQLSTGSHEVSFEKAVKTAALPSATPRSDAIPSVPEGTWPTIVVDPPWEYDNRATRNAAAKKYRTMAMSELEELEIPAAPDTHLYLWVTNSFLREGFDLVESWGFVYKTMLTWVKPQIGLGNYFRNSTEHVLFGVKGNLPTNRKDVPTWFKADRKRHSEKPESFYDLAETVSPAPWLEMFARRRRFGWDVWGDEA